MRAPATLLEQLVERQFQRGQDGKPTKDDALQAAHAGMRAAREFAEQASHARETILKDASRTPGANQIRIRDVTTRLIESAAKALDAAHAKVSSEVQRLQRGLEPLFSP